jgi:hypothetical protein
METAPGVKYKQYRKEGPGRFSVNKPVLIFTNMSKNSKRNFALVAQIWAVI